VIVIEKLCYQIILTQVYYLISVTILSFKPFDDPKKLKLELFNEITMLMILICIMGFSDIVPTLEQQFLVGYVCSAIILVHLAINIFLIFRVTYKGLAMYLKLFRLKQQAKK